MSTTTAPAFLDAFRTQLLARGGLAGVTVWTAHPGDDLGTEDIVFHTVTGDQQPQSFSSPHNREEIYQVAGFIFCLKPGAGETVIKQARDRATAILAEVENQMRTDPTAAGSILFGQLQDHKLLQSVKEEGRWAMWEFNCSVRSSI